MYPILYQSPGFILYTQTACFVAAFMAGLWLAIREGRCLGVPRFELTNVVLIGFIGSLAGARAFFLLLTWQGANLTLRELCFLGESDGGFAFQGGLVFGGLTAWLVTRAYRLSVWRMGDALAPGLALALAVLRVGCLLNGCDYGVPTTQPWGLLLHGHARHPIQLYEGLGNLALLPILFRLNRRGRQPGATLLVYLCLSSLVRLGVDAFRDDPFRYRQLTLPQWLAAGLAAAAGIALWHRLRPPQSVRQQDG